MADSDDGYDDRLSALQIEEMTPEDFILDLLNRSFTEAEKLARGWWGPMIGTDSLLVSNIGIAIFNARIQTGASALERTVFGPSGRPRE